MQQRDLLKKLLRVERTVNVYYVESDELLEEINIDNIPFDELKKIVPPTADDPLLYDGYELDIIQVEKINFYLSKKIVTDFNLYTYILVCGGIYNWDAE